MSIRGMLASAILGAAVSALGGCSSQPEQPPAAIQEEKLTPERARETLLEMVRSEPAKGLGWFGGNIPDEMAKMTIEEEQDGWYSWTAAFRFNPSKAVYTFAVRPKPGARACAFEYEGAFVRKDGVWSATPPELVRTKLQSGE